MKKGQVPLIIHRPLAFKSIQTLQAQESITSDDTRDQSTQFIPKRLSGGDTRCSFPSCDFPTACQRIEKPESMCWYAQLRIFSHLRAEDGQMEAAASTFLYMLATNHTSSRCRIQKTGEGGGSEQIPVWGLVGYLGGC